MKHTPTPWSFVKYDMNYDNGYAIHEESFGCVAERWEYSNKDTKRIEQIKANGEFIVKACNSHHELLEAVKLALQKFQEFPLKLEIMDTLKQAIAKAEGK